ncbi:hypothetical protein IWQ61_007306 [Dispira simplex]|nr:hypothetical protein IWQ61_007306 [Dispira simplex]
MQALPLDPDPVLDSPIPSTAKDDTSPSTDPKHSWLKEELQAVGELKREAIASRFPDEWRRNSLAAEVWVPAHLHPEIAPSEFQAWVEQHGHLLTPEEQKPLQRRRSILSMHSYSSIDLSEIEEGNSQVPTDSSSQDGPYGDQVTAVIRRRNTTDSRSVGSTSLSTLAESLAKQPEDPHDGTWVIQNIRRSGLKRSKRSNLRRDSVLSEGSRRRRQLRSQASSQSGVPRVQVDPTADSSGDALSSPSPEAPSPASSNLVGILSEITATLEASPSGTTELMSTSTEVPLPLTDPTEQSPYTRVTGIPMSTGPSSVVTVADTPSLASSEVPPTSELSVITQLASWDDDLTQHMAQISITNSPSITTSQPVDISFGSDPPNLNLHLDSPVSFPPSGPTTSARPSSSPVSKPVDYHTHTGHHGNKKTSAWSWLWGSDADPTSPSSSHHSHSPVSEGPPHGGSSGATPPNSLSKASHKSKKPSTISYLFSKTKLKLSASDSTYHARKSISEEYTNSDAGQGATAEQEDTGTIPTQGADHRGTASEEFPTPLGEIVSARPPIRYTNYNRYPIHIERAIYRLSHIKLANPRRPLLHQVLISNMMFWYLSIINPRTTLPNNYYGPDSMGQPPYDGDTDPNRNGGGLEEGMGDGYMTTGYAEYNASPGGNGPTSYSYDGGNGHPPSYRSQPSGYPGQNGDGNPSGPYYSQYGYQPNGHDSGEQQEPNFSPIALTPHNIPPSLTPGRSNHGPGEVNGGKKSGRNKKGGRNRNGKHSAEVVAIRSPQYSKQKQHIHQGNPRPGPSSNGYPGGNGGAGAGSTSSPHYPPSSYDSNLARSHNPPASGISPSGDSDDEDDMPLALYTTDYSLSPNALMVAQSPRTSQLHFPLHVLQCPMLSLLRPSIRWSVLAIAKKETNNPLHVNPVLQVLTIRRLPPNANQATNGPVVDRFRLFLTDGVHSVHGMLASQLSELVTSEKIQTNSIIRLNQFVCNVVKEKLFVVLLQLEVLEKSAIPVTTSIPVENVVSIGGGVSPQGNNSPYTPSTVASPAANTGSTMSSGIGSANTASPRPANPHGDNASAAVTG